MMYQSILYKAIQIILLIGIRNNGKKISDKTIFYNNWTIDRK